MHSPTKDKFEVVMPVAFSPKPPKPLNEVQRVLMESLQRLEGGARWCKDNGSAEWGRADAYCTILAVDSESFVLDDRAIRALVHAHGGSIGDVYQWNDRPERTFADVEALCRRAIELAA